MQEEIVEVIRFAPEQPLPPVRGKGPFKAVVVTESTVSPDWQAKVSEWLVKSGCLYMMAWGPGCSSWDDSVDMANLEAFGYQEIPDEHFVMTTWHEHETLAEVFWFAKNCARHAGLGLEQTVILHISSQDSSQNKAQVLKSQYENA